MIEVQIAKGDIAQETTDSIVNPTDRNLTNGGICSKRILDIGGHVI